jgi:alpha-beta hydrolase superfamily lysophospholipase
MSDLNWRPDILGAGYDQHVFRLGADPDGEGDIEAVLVRRSPRPGEVTRGAVLYVHGFTDYFFQTGLADFFAARGLRFYALDLRKCGRAHVHRGIETGVPVLVLRSDKSLTAGEYSPVCDRCDLVLNTKQIGRWARSLGGQVTDTVVADARHDVFLSVPEARQRAYAALGTWLDRLPMPLT